MSNDNSGSTRSELVVELLTAYRNWIGVTIALAVIAVLAIEPDLPTVVIQRPHKVFLIAAFLAAILGAAPVWWLIKKLYDPPKRFLVQPGVTDEEGGVWELTPKAFQDLYVKGDELYQWPGTEYPTYEVEWYDPENNIAKGTWRGSATDGELIQDREKIDQVRGKLQERAQERDVLVTRAETIVRQAVMENARLLVKEYNRASLIDVNAFSDKLEEILSETDLVGEKKKERDRQTDPSEEPADPNLDDSPTARQPAAADGGQETQQ